MTETPAQWAARTCAEQGVALVVTDDELLEQAAAILRPLLANDNAPATTGALSGTGAASQRQNGV